MGKYKGEYADNQDEINRLVKEEAGWKCERCRHDDETKAGYTLTVHHLDGDKANNARWNLAALCQRCHLRIQGKVFMPQMFMFEHSAWFKPHVEGYYASMGIDIGWGYQGVALLRPTAPTVQ
jgi:hypothetical protein